MTPRVQVTARGRLFIGGAFTPSQSARTYALAGAGGEPSGHAALGSRKDVRDAVTAARAAADGWAGLAPLRRGQALYRVAGRMEERSAQLAAEVAAAEGGTPAQAAAAVGAAVDRWVWYAGWADKVAEVTGGVHAVAGPYVSWSAPAPGGVVGAVAPQESSLLGLVGVLAPALAGGAVAVVLASEARPRPALLVAECLAVAGLPGGAANILTGRTAELAPPLAAHGGVDALDLAGAHALAAQLEAAAAGGLKRMLAPARGHSDWAAEPGLERLLLACETTTVWAPAGT